MGKCPKSTIIQSIDIPSILILNVRATMEATFAVSVALYSTDLDESVKFDFRNERQVAAFHNPSTSLSVAPSLNVRVHFPFY